VNDTLAYEVPLPERWRDVPNVILSPHVAGVTHESIERLRAAATRNLTTVVEGGSLVNAL
jgi:hydroxypyruvate reductase